MTIKYEERPLRIYFKAKVGDQLLIKRRRATIIKIISYKKVIEEMIKRGISEAEIKKFDQKVQLYLGNKRKYFECLVKYKDGTVDRLDWWQYAQLRWREEERKWRKKLEKEQQDFI